MKSDRDSIVSILAQCTCAEASCTDCKYEDIVECEFTRQADALVKEGLRFPKHAHWEKYWDDNYLSWCHKCSNCGSFPLTKEETAHDEVLSNYCPNCGALMDGGK